MNIFKEIIVISSAHEFIEIEIQLTGHGSFEALHFLDAVIDNEDDELRVNRAVIFCKELLLGARKKNVLIIDVIRRLPRSPDFEIEMLILKKIAEKYLQILNLFNEVAA